MKILDCTLRDGGYYTEWDFSEEIVTSYCNTMESFDISYVEIGYRSLEQEGYYGEYFYCPIHVINKLKSLMPNKKLAVIINEKDINVSSVSDVLSPCIGYIDMVRIALDPIHFSRGIELASKVKDMGFCVALNIMYMSQWTESSKFLDFLPKLGKTVDYLYLVDSFGGMLPKDIKNKISLIRSCTRTPLGFHGHNNLELALANSIIAIEEGCEIIDCTVSGIGRGAGNLKTELLMIYLAKTLSTTNLDSLCDTVSIFEKLRANYQWGTNIPYMISGAFSLPQKEIMELIGMERYPFSTIISIAQKNALNKDNLKVQEFKFSNPKDKVLLLGGGYSLKESLIIPLKKFLSTNPDIPVIHTGIKYIYDFKDLSNRQYYCINGYEPRSKLSKVLTNLSEKQSIILTPNTLDGEFVLSSSNMAFISQIKAYDFTIAYEDSTLATALQLSLLLKASISYLIGFDGYRTEIDQSKIRLTKENQNIFNDYIKYNKCELHSLSKTNYDGLVKRSMYSLL